ncbi:Putative flagellin YvzB [Bacillus subtilis]|nr:Putative flagellin YvzB [Bacillus subtilis]
MDALIEEVDGISNRTEFNGKKLLDGTETDGFTFQIGANAGQQLTVNIDSMSSTALGVNELNVTDLLILLLILNLKVLIVQLQVFQTNVLNLVRYKTV